eukprot:TRINITY_DN10788_c0_g1_i3.p3 TRINITY_DN10788_c0_g1~~TRINITY_DN10788_c0_g1_i3.p3  ORF type:complete len:123 (+),score=11.22 TRINITY_DN10788_c0_g1_i3:670-1038(+)
MFNRLLERQQLLLNAYVPSTQIDVMPPTLADCDVFHVFKGLLNADQRLRIFLQSFGSDRVFVKDILQFLVLVHKPVPKCLQGFYASQKQHHVLKIVVHIMCQHMLLVHEVRFTLTEQAAVFS